MTRATAQRDTVACRAFVLLGDLGVLAVEVAQSLPRASGSEYDAGRGREARVGNGRKEEGRWSLSFNAWIAIAVGLLVVIVLGLHVPVYLRYRHEQKVVAEMHRLGGGVTTGRHAPPWPMSVLADRWEPYGRLFDRAHAAALGCTTATDAAVADLAGLTELQELGLNAPQFTDAGLVHLTGLTQLRRLYLDFTQVTDAGLVHLAGLTKLQVLNLFDTQVTDASLVHLSGLTLLKELTLAGTRVTGAGLVHLAGLTKLEALFLEDTQVTDAGLVHLAGLTQLEDLGLDNTQVTDAGLVHLAGLANLRKLHLRNTQVTDAGVAQLERKLPGLTVRR
jgi:hypothetical protein